MLASFSFQTTTSSTSITRAPFSHPHLDPPSYSSNTCPFIRFLNPLFHHDHTSIIIYHDLWIKYMWASCFVFAFSLIRMLLCDSQSYLHLSYVVAKHFDDLPTTLSCLPFLFRFNWYASTSSIVYVKKKDYAREVRGLKKTISQYLVHISRFVPVFFCLMPVSLSIGFVEQESSRCIILCISHQYAVPKQRFKVSPGHLGW